MLKRAATFLLLGLALTVLIRMALDGFFNPMDWTAAAGVFGTINCLIILILLAQRAVWRSSPKVLRSLYWPGVVSACLLGLSGIAIFLNREADIYLLRVGGCIVLMSCLSGFSLWRTRRAG